MIPGKDIPGSCHAFTTKSEPRGPSLLPFRRPNQDGISLDKIHFNFLTPNPLYSRIAPGQKLKIVNIQNYRRGQPECLFGALYSCNALVFSLQSHLRSFFPFFYGIQKNQRKQKNAHPKGEK